MCNVTAASSIVTTTPLPPQIAYYVTHHGNHTTLYNNHGLTDSSAPIIHGYMARRPQRRIPDRMTGNYGLVTTYGSNVPHQQPTSIPQIKQQQNYRFIVVPNDRYRKFIKSSPRPVSAYQHYNYDVLFDKKPPETKVRTSPTKRPAIALLPSTSTESPAIVVPANMPLPSKSQPDLSMLTGEGDSVRRNPDPQIHIVLRRRRKPGKVVYKQFSTVPVRNGIKMLKIKHRNVYKQPPGMDDAIPMRRPKAHASNLRVVTPGRDIIDDFDDDELPSMTKMHKVRNHKKVPVKYTSKPKMRRPPHRHKAPIRMKPARYKSNRPSMSIRRPPPSKNDDDYEYQGDISEEYPRSKKKNKRKKKPYKMHEENYSDEGSSADDGDDDDDDDDIDDDNSIENMRYTKRTRKPRERRKLPPNHKESPKMKDYTFYITKYDKSDRNLMQQRPRAIKLDQNDDEALKNFVPARMLASVRHVEQVKHQPKHQMHPNVKKRVVEKGGHLVYTEDGYEDNDYDHGIRESYAHNHKRHRRDTSSSELLQSRKYTVPEFINMLSGDTTHFFNYRSPIEQIQRAMANGRRKVKNGFRRKPRYSTAPPVREHTPISYYDTKPQICDDIDFDEETVDPDGDAEKAPKKRLNGLGDKIDCMRVKLFGADPFNNPLFVDTYIV